MRILVCGGRDFANRDLFNKTLNDINKETPISVILHGNARGADSMSWSWILKNNQGRCDETQLECIAFNADWDKYGKAAGPIRNKQMLDEGKPDLVIAFLAEGSKGTKNMIDQATKAGVEVKVINI